MQRRGDHNLVFSWSKPMFYYDKDKLMNATRFRGYYFDEDFQDHGIPFHEPLKAALCR
ncbi:hypothetical protein [Candidatus Jidaibacter acanthamoebae]|nr:hypothetical protein [Candidatus Jidaibacter acanthamoeba]